MITASDGGYFLWRKLLDRPREYETALGTDQKAQEFEAEEQRRFDGSDEVDVK